MKRLSVWSDIWQTADWYSGSTMSSGEILLFKEARFITEKLVWQDSVSIRCYFILEKKHTQTNILQTVLNSQLSQNDPGYVTKVMTHNYNMGASRSKNTGYVHNIHKEKFLTCICHFCQFQWTDDVSFKVLETQWNMIQQIQIE